MKHYWNFILIALLGGVIGLQEFYMRRWVLGVLAVLFWWTCIPGLVAFVEAMVWLFQGESQFDKKYNTDGSQKKQLLMD